MFKKMSSILKIVRMLPIQKMRCQTSLMRLRLSK
jgi:hypothetical protein